MPFPAKSSSESGFSASAAIVSPVPTMRDVAAAAGVSASTVSRALRDDPRITEATRLRVKDTARALGYRANPYVTALTTQVRTRRASPLSPSVAVLETGPGPHSKAEWFRRYLAGIRTCAAEQGFSIDLLCIGSPGIPDSEAVGRVLRARGIRGLLVMPSTGHASLEGIPFSSLACATIDPSLHEAPIHRASPDYYQGMNLALDSLQARGFRRIGFCTSRSELSRIGGRWMGGYLAWQHERNAEGAAAPFLALDFEPHPTARGQAAEWRRNRRLFATWLEREQPDAVVSNLVFIAEWLHELGCDGANGVRYASLGLSAGDTWPGIDQRFEQVGAAAFNLVSAQIYRNEVGLPAAPTTVLVPGVWCEGDLP